jgi:hypothetical protein
MRLRQEAVAAYGVEAHQDQDQDQDDQRALERSPA